ncbi:hypothetical protein SJI00_13175 [Pseudomonas sp. RP23018S]|uniref:hypothetical protein n=1 Tax=Pseudomonas sp. RP23018S TaxID=3096037 RepID=UPI002ACAB2F6|nr:hypothetical protein [Pseudomonas sp. RP23018S]MDZ5603728.1 hypothetical protein [Pseudomonas sp. RP23018S]
MKRHMPVIALLIGALAVSGPAAAHGWRGAGPVLGAAVVGAVVGAAVSGGHKRPVYVEREPTYYAPPPVYVQAPPQPVYYEQPYVVERYVPVPPPPPPQYRRYYGPPPGYYYGPPPRW